MPSRAALLYVAALTLLAAGCRIDGGRVPYYPDRGANRPARQEPVSKAPLYPLRGRAPEPDWAKAFDGHESSDVDTPDVEPRFVRSEWRSNQYDGGAVRNQWEVRITDSGQAVRYGVFRRYYPAGTLEVLGAYKNGRPTGIWTWYDENGTLIREARQGAIEEELRGAALRSPLSVFRTPSGQPLAEGQLKHDKGHGRWVYYYSNGAPRAEGAFQTGVPEGLWQSYYPNGEIEQQVHFSLGVPDGPYRRAYPGGQEQERGQYEQGLRTGLWRSYYENAQEQERGQYQEDRREGEWDFWSESGELIRRTVYRNGEAVEQLPLPAKPPEPEAVIPDVDALPNPPRIYDENGGQIRTRENYDPAPAKPPVLHPRPPPPAPLSQWRTPAGTVVPPQQR